MRDSLWEVLQQRFKIFIPFMLVEEAIARTTKPGALADPIVRELISRVVDLRDWWMEDVHETAFKELVEERTIAHLQAPNGDIMRGISAIRLGDPSLEKWIRDRKRLKRETADDWRRDQERWTSASPNLKLERDQDFIREVGCVFKRSLGDPHRKTDLLEAILGRPFRSFHPEVAAQIDAAFDRYSTETFRRYPVTHDCLLTRLCYFFAPVVTIVPRGAAVSGKLIKSGGQFNSATDEQYVVSALMCHRLITGDLGMSKMMFAFQRVGRWKGSTIFIDPNHPVADQIRDLAV